MIEPKDELKFILNHVEELELQNACWISICFMGLIGYYIEQIGRRFPDRTFGYHVVKYGQNWELNIRWVSKTGFFEIQSEDQEDEN